MKIISTVLLYSLLLLHREGYVLYPGGVPRESYPVYNGNDLGVHYSRAGTGFKVWAPGASAVKLRLYAAGEGGTALRTVDLDRGVSGTWSATLSQDIKNL